MLSSDDLSIVSEMEVGAGLASKVVPALSACLEMTWIFLCAFGCSDLLCDQCRTSGQAMALRMAGYLQLSAKTECRLQVIHAILAFSKVRALGAAEVSELLKRCASAVRHF